MSVPLRLVNAVYYPSWKVYKDKPPSILDYKCITHVLYAFLGVSETGDIRHLDEWADLEKEVDGHKGCLSALAALKRQHCHIRTLVSVGGGTASKEFPALAASRRAREAFTTRIKQFCDRHALDGVDIDWEHPKSPEQGADYIKLMSELRQALPPPRYIVSTALPATKYCLKNINLAHLSQVVDQVNLMCYDFTGGWSAVAGYHAQLHTLGRHTSVLHPDLHVCANTGIEYALSEGIPSHKIILGVPAYARYFPHANEPGQPFQNAGEMDYCDLPAHWVHQAEILEDIGAASFVDSRGGKGFASFDIPKTVEIKAKFVRARCLGGLFYWTGAGDRAGSESLVNAGYRELLRA